MQTSTYHCDKSLSTISVAAIGDKVLSACNLAEMADVDWLKGIQERLRWVLANRTDENGKRFTQTSLSKAAGLSPSHVGMVLRGDVRERLSAQVVAKMASAAKVSSTWLSEGQGSPDDTASTSAFPNRDRAAAVAREGGVGEAAVRSVLDEPGDEQTVLWWLDRMRTREIIFRSEQPSAPKDQAPAIPRPAKPPRALPTNARSAPAKKRGKPA